MGLDVMVWLNSSPAYAIFEATPAYWFRHHLFAITSLLKCISIFTSHPASPMILLIRIVILGFSLPKKKKKKSTIKILVNWKANNNIFESQTNIYLSSHCLSGHVQTCSMLGTVLPHREHSIRRVTPLCWRRAAIWGRDSWKIYSLRFRFWCRYTIHRNALEHSIIIMQPIDVYSIWVLSCSTWSGHNGTTHLTWTTKPFAKCLPSTKSIIWKLLLLLLLFTLTTNATAHKMERNGKEIVATKITDKTKMRIPCALNKELEIGSHMPFQLILYSVWIRTACMTLVTICQSQRTKELRQKWKKKICQRKVSM